MESRKDICADPLHRHSTLKRTDLRKVTSELLALHPSKLQPGQRLCSGCRKALNVLPPETPQQAASSSSTSDPELPHSDAEFVEPVAEIETLNQTLEAVGESPFMKRKSDRFAKYRTEKRSKVEAIVKKRLDMVAGPSKEKCDGNCMPNVIKGLKDKFATSTRSEQVEILTIFAGHMSLRDLMAEFECSRRMASLARNLQEEKGIMTSPNPKKGKTLCEETTNAATDFYRSDECSRLMPGKKDCLVVRTTEGKQTLQKRLVLMNLNELYEKFKEAHPSVKVGFSKFASMRPPECVLAGASGTHSVCVCTIHQNIKLMMIGSKMKEIANFNTYRDVITKLVCDPPSVPNCYFRECEACIEKVSDIKTELMAAYDDHAVDEVQFQLWTTTDRSQLLTVTLPLEEFVDNFSENILKLVRHDFIAKTQAAFLQQKKEDLVNGEFVVIGDFSENFSFVVQDAAQGYHWTNAQATIHPWVFYYREGEKILHGSLTIISDFNKHDVISVHLFQRKLISHLNSLFPVVKKIYYFSDGCAAQYKNCKSFLNLCYHNDDFHCDAEWHFFATSHGKGPSDGVGGTIKREATKESLRRPYENQIITPKRLYEFAIGHLKSMHFQFTTEEDYNSEQMAIEQRLQLAKTIAGTQKLHCILPKSNSSVAVREYSTCDKERLVAVVSRSKRQ